MFIFSLMGCGGSGSGSSNTIHFDPAPLTAENVINGAKASFGSAQVAGLSGSIFQDSAVLLQGVAKLMFQNEPVEIDKNVLLTNTLQRYATIDKPNITGSFIDDPEIVETWNSLKISGDIWADYNPPDDISGGKMKLDIILYFKMDSEHELYFSFDMKVSYDNFYYNDAHWLYEEGTRLNGALRLFFDDTFNENDDFEAIMYDFGFDLTGSITYTLLDGVSIEVIKNQLIGFEDLDNLILKINGQDTVISNGMGIIYQLHDVIIGVEDDMPVSGTLVAQSGEETCTITIHDDMIDIDGVVFENPFTPFGAFEQ